ncbi:Type I phosphodiesterase / nucleotide pyrophosphatase [Fodinibius roseus]|uniref:Type I phosphodiesterase / nucleotide pyrophosphatase n=1 Tax=Fodinibius roseus TaxID=1194090 RepID=A0A1M4UZH2_9BACT|nr:alkaline phosphatase PafA [Fodinibius roseus]SHE62134.1 Type I phosphodiesterase / nucleotide pyrophosphatase [Fodinibius roseus]
MKTIKTIGISLLLFFAALQGGWAQDHNGYGSEEDRPKLVVGIVVDQMRYDYLPRYWDKFEEGGFKRLVGEGYNFRNHHYNYFPTYTGPGHAAIYTGTTPSVNGIVGNSWYDRSIGKDMYVVSDSTARPVGTDGETGKMSPANLMSTTITDELKSADQESKVVAVSTKDRGAVLPAGHLGDGAYWYEGASGNFITSSWYADALPDWVRQFNEEGLAKELSNKIWATLLPIEEYTESNPDNTPYEGSFEKEKKPVFPHNLAENRGDAYGIINSTPFGNTLVKELAKQALEAEKLGADEATDFLSVSFSSTDYVGHKFGPHSVELQDTYLRLDRDLADLLEYLDQKVGEGNYLVMLTSDHGAVDVPAELMDKKLPGGYFNSNGVIEVLERYLDGKYGEGEWVEAYANQQVYLNRELVRSRKHLLKKMQQEIADFLLQFKAVASTNTAYNFRNKYYADGYQAMYQRGFQHNRSGDVYIQLKPGWLDSRSDTGTSHGSPYNYDTHVPLLFYGWGVPRGETTERTVIPQIAPTLSMMLDIGFPTGSPAQVLDFK